MSVQLRKLLMITQASHMLVPIWIFKVEPVLDKLEKNPKPLASTRQPPCPNNGAARADRVRTTAALSPLVSPPPPPQP
jgi:hypothetical protein